MKYVVFMEHLTRRGDVVAGVSCDPYVLVAARAKELGIKNRNLKTWVEDYARIYLVIDEAIDLNALKQLYNL